MQFGNYRFNSKIAKSKLMLTELFLALFISTILIITTVYLLNFYHVTQISLKQIQEMFYVPSGLIKPDPKEKFIFITTLLLIPLFCYFSLAIAKRSVNNLKSTFATMLLVFLSVLFVFSSLWIFYNSDYMIVIILKIFPITPKHLHRFLLLSILTVTFCLIPPKFFIKNKNVNLINGIKKLLSILAKSSIIFLVVLIFLQTFTFRIMDLDSINYNQISSFNFDAVFYSVSQVVAGKTLLADLTAQYGLYAELLAPIFKLIGLSTLKFTIVCAILETLGMFSLLYFCLRVMKNKILVFLCIVSLVLITGFIWSGGNFITVTPYYQYYPLRFLFPTISLFFFLRFRYQLNAAQLTLMSVVSALSIIWNLDSGIPVLGAYLCYLGTYLIFPRNNISRINAIKKILYSVFIIAFSVTLFMLYLYCKADHVIDFEAAFKAQHLFFVSGFMHLPLPKDFFAVWHVIILIYVLGLMSAILAWKRSSTKLIWDAVFYLSILGFGLFSYYEYRAHFNCLILCSWPAIIIVFILSDYLLRLCKARHLPKIYALLALPIIFISLIFSLELSAIIPKLYQFTLINWHLAKNTSRITTENLNFIKSHLHNDKSAVILSLRQAVYFGELGLVSAIDSPGIAEIVLKADKLREFSQISSTHAKIFMELCSGLPNMYSKALSQYHIKDKNKNGFVYLVRN